MGVLAGPETREAESDHSSQQCECIYGRYPADSWFAVPLEDFNYMTTQPHNQILQEYPQPKDHRTDLGRMQSWIVLPSFSLHAVTLYS